jgi:hypothetical protein
MAQPLVVAITGPFQSGKTELQPVFESEGFDFLNLNDIRNRMRRAGTTQYRLYNDLIPGSLTPDGNDTLAFYQGITGEIRDALMPAEVAYVAAETRNLILALQPDQKIVLSWALWPWMLDVPIDHMIFPEQPRDLWIERLYRRITERGWFGWKPSLEEIERIIQAMRYDPDVMKAKVMASIAPITSVIDVSSEDWGEPQVRAKLQLLASSRRASVT